MLTTDRTQPVETYTAPRPAHNKLLAALSSEDYVRLAPSLKPVLLRSKDSLHKQGERLTRVYFPSAGSLSLIKQMSDGEVAEITTIGREGMVGAHVFFGEVESVSDITVQVEGEASAMAVDAFTAEMNRRGYFYNLIIRYCAALSNHVMQIGVCNSLHSAEQRACRWLLLTHDRVGRDEFPLTHDFMAAMLGVRRPTVTLIVTSLQRAGLIACRRGVITIVDRQGLEVTACECYAAVNASFGRLLPELGGATSAFGIDRSA